jgi:hypothetical protein
LSSARYTSLSFFFFFGAPRPIPRAGMVVLRYKLCCCTAAPYIRRPMADAQDQDAGRHRKLGITHLCGMWHVACGLRSEVLFLPRCRGARCRGVFGLSICRETPKNARKKREKPGAVFHRRVLVFLDSRCYDTPKDVIK